MKNTNDRNSANNGNDRQSNPDYLICDHCGYRHYASETNPRYRFVDVSSTIGGADLITFDCLNCSTDGRRSLVYRGDIK